MVVCNADRQLVSRQAQMLWMCVFVSGKGFEREIKEYSRLFFHVACRRKKPNKAVVRKPLEGSCYVISSNRYSHLSVLHSGAGGTLSV